LQQGIEELPNLITEFAGAKSHHAPGEKSKAEALLGAWEEEDPFKNTPLAEKHDLIRGHLIMTRIMLQDVRDKLVNAVKDWPKDAGEIIDSSPEVQEELGNLEGILHALLSTVGFLHFDLEASLEASQNEDLRMGALPGIEERMREYEAEAKQKDEQENQENKDEA